MRDLTAPSRRRPWLQWQHRLRRLAQRRWGRPLLTGLDTAWWAHVALVSALGVLLGLGGARAATGDLSPPEAVAHRIAQAGTMHDLLAYAYENNALIAAARAAWQATVESYRVATGLPDPQLTITYFTAPLETRLGPQDWNATLSQHIPFPGKLSKAGEVVQTEARIARLQLDKTVRDVVASIRASFYELTYIRQAKKIAADNARLLEQIRAVPPVYLPGHWPRRHSAKSIDLVDREER